MIEEEAKDAFILRATNGAILRAKAVRVSIYKGPSCPGESHHFEAHSEAFELLAQIA